MRQLRGRAGRLATLVAVVVTVAVSGCGGGARTSSDATSDTPVGPATATASVVTLVQPAFPASLDPQTAASPEAAEATWVTYTGLVSYAHRSGPSGAALIPGLGTALPQISDGGRVYTVTLRPGLRFSNGLPVQASDFVYTLERAIRLPGSPAAQYLDPTVAGAAAFASHRATSVSGVSADDRTGRIVIHLVAPDSGFSDLLAAPALGIVSRDGSPDAARPRDPPAGCGPYEIRDVDPRRGYTLALDPRWKPLPGIPAGRVDIAVRVSPDLTAGANAVLNNIADLLDWPIQISSTLAGEIASQASGRFAQLDPGAVTNYIFFNARQQPFANRLAREAVAVGLDRDAIARATPGLLAPACDLLPPAIVNRPANGFCPTGQSDDGDLTRARSLVRRSGTAGQYVTVWTPAGGPPQQWMSRYARFLDSIGFRAYLQPVQAAGYAPNIPRLVPAAQTGFASASAAVPDPVALFDALLTGRGTGARGSRDVGEIHDSRLDHDLSRLSAALTSEQADAAWGRIDDDITRGSQAVELGYSRFPFLASARIDYPALKISPIYGWDYTSVQLIH